MWSPLVDRFHLPKWNCLVDPNCGPLKKDFCSIILFLKIFCPIFFFAKMFFLNFLFQIFFVKIFFPKNSFLNFLSKIFCRKPFASIFFQRLMILCFSVEELAYSRKKNSKNLCNFLWNHLKRIWSKC